MKGEVEIDRVRGKSVVTRRFASYPLRFLFTSSGGGSIVWVYAITFGGGIVSGDLVHFSMRVKAGSRCLLTTQASTKVFKKVGDGVARQEMEAVVEQGALLCVAPDPVTCFKSAKYCQKQSFRLAEQANLLYVDWISSGRTNGFHERWEMDLYNNSTHIHVNDQPVFLEDIVLENNEENKIQQRMGRMNVLATVVIIGDVFGEAASEDSLKSRLVDFPRVHISVSSLFRNAGRAVRIAGEDIEPVENVLKALFAPWSELLGGNRYVNVRG